MTRRLYRPAWHAAHKRGLGPLHMNMRPEHLHLEQPVLVFLGFPRFPRLGSQASHLDTRRRCRFHSAIMPPWCGKSPARDVDRRLRPRLGRILGRRRVRPFITCVSRQCRTSGRLRRHESNGFRPAGGRQGPRRRPLRCRAGSARHRKSPSATAITRSPRPRPRIQKVLSASWAICYRWSAPRSCP